MHHVHNTIGLKRIEREWLIIRRTIRSYKHPRKSNGRETYKRLIVVACSKDAGIFDDEVRGGRGTVVWIGARCLNRLTGRCVLDVPPPTGLTLDGLVKDLRDYGVAWIHRKYSVRQV